MFYQSPYSLTYNMISSSPLPNIHPQDIDCIIRSENNQKGSLYVSNLEGAQNPITLQKLRISAIITCAQGYRLDHPRQIIKQYKYIPLSKIENYGLSEYFNEAADFIQDSLLKYNVMAHCLTGCGRSIFLIITYLIKHKQMSYTDAYSYMQKKRKFINFDQGFQLALLQFQKDCRKSFKTNDKSRNKLTTYQQNLKTQRSSDKNSQKEMNKKNKQDRIFSFSDRNSLSVIPSSDYKSSRVSIKNKQIHKDLIKQNQNDKNQNAKYKSREQTHKSKISQKEISNQSITHSQAKKFQMVLSSSHQEYTAVKRDLKNSAMSQMKQKRSKTLQYQTNNRLETSRFETSKNHLKSSHVTNRSVQKSVSDQLNNSRASYVSQKLATQRTQSQCSMKINIMNPEDRRSLMAKKFNDSRASQLSPSKLQYFKEIDEKLTKNINSILTQYQTESRNIREKYHHKLRTLRLNVTSLNSKEIF